MTGPDVVGGIDAIEQWARRDPDRPALVASTSVSYAALVERSDALADELMAAGLTAGQAVAVVGQRGVPAVVAMLTALRAGGHYVPISTAQPQKRRDLVLSAARPAVIVDIHGDGGHTLRAPGEPHTSEGLAWIVFTSGSTGRPKGVAVSRLSMNWHLQAAGAAFQLSSEDRVLHAAGLDFDVAAEELWPTLAVGATVVIHEADLAVTGFADFTDFVDRHGVTVVNLPASYFAGWAAYLRDSDVDPPATLRLVVAGSERLPAQAAHTWLNRPESPQLFNAYGLSETTITCIAGRVSASQLDNRDTAPIGVALPGVTCRLIGPDGAEVAGDGVGQLEVAGACVAEGYLGDPELTGERFVSGENGERWLRTGDVAQRVGETLYVVGRADDQLKVRGRRIEPGEVEAALVAVLGVSDARVLLHDGQLVAVVAGGAGSDVDTGDIANWRERLAPSLPEYLLPASLVRLDRLPTTAGGKVDVVQLRELVAHAGADKAAQGPNLTATAEVADPRGVVLTVAREVLGNPTADENTHFFAAGGTSLNAAMLVGRLNAALGVGLSLDVVFASPVLGQLAEAVAKEAASKGGS